MADESSVSIIVSSDAAERLETLRFYRQLEMMFDHLKSHVAGLREIAVTPCFVADDPTKPALMINVYKDFPDNEPVPADDDLRGWIELAEKDPTERECQVWLERTFSPDVAEWFYLSVHAAMPEE